ncbi:MAG: hypothetical protein ACREHG_05595, partial [Candidatus Saccharimonadales bacterium]
MTSALYPLWKQQLIAGDANATLTGSGTTGLYCAMVTASYTYSSSHQYYSSLAGLVGTDQEITSVTYTTGTVKGNDVTYTSVASGSTINALILYRKNTGANSTWELVGYLDSANVSGLPAVTNGGNITIA